MKNRYSIFPNGSRGGSRLNEFELLQSQSRDATVVGVFDLVALAEGGAQEADRVGAMSLDLEMDRTDCFQGGYTIRE